MIEVLSDSTEACDRGDKFIDYKSNPLLEEYVLIHQNHGLLEQFLRRSNSLWVPQIYRAGDIVEFVSIRFRCAIAVLYENINQLQSKAF